MKSALLTRPRGMRTTLVVGRLGPQPWWVAAYTRNPLVNLVSAGNEHVDLLGVFCHVVAAFSLRATSAR
jgi:hypothetical protein